jgi:hypothetical protein
MPRRRSMKLEDTMRPEVLGREAVQLAVVAVLSAAAIVFGPRWLQLVAAAVDALVAIACAAGLVVAVRVARRSRALALYGPAAAIFAALAVLGFRG